MNELKNRTDAHKAEVTDLLTTMDNTTETYQQIASLLTFLDDLAASLDNIANLAAVARRRRDTSPSCSSILGMVTSYTTAIDNINIILAKLNAIGTTTNDIVNTFVNNAKALFEKQLVDLEKSKSDLELYSDQECSSTTTTTPDILTTQSPATLPTSTSPNAVEAIVSSASSLQSDTEAKIAELEAILANLTPGTDIYIALNDLLTTLKELSGDLGIIAAGTGRVSHGKSGVLLFM